MSKSSPQARHPIFIHCKTPYSILLQCRTLCRSVHGSISASVVSNLEKLPPYRDTLTSYTQSYYFPEKYPSSVQRLMPDLGRQNLRLTLIHAKSWTTLTRSTHSVTTDLPKNWILMISLMHPVEVIEILWCFPQQNRMSYAINYV